MQAADFSLYPQIFAEMITALHQNMQATERIYPDYQIYLLQLDGTVLHLSFNEG